MRNLMRKREKERKELSVSDISTRRKKRVRRATVKLEFY